VPEAVGTPLCRVDEIPDGRARGFTLGDAKRLRIFAVRRGAELHVYVNRCPHVGTPLDWTPDEFLDHEGRHILCSTHGALFRIDDGYCVAGPCSGDALEPFPFAVRDGVLYALDEFAEDFD
jgi:nitrite reductase/ring-hydroxylating ferredoxin subunit